MYNGLFETEKNSLMPHGCHIYKTASHTAMVKMCAYPPYQYTFTQWKPVLRCFGHCPCSYIPGQ